MDSFQVEEPERQGWFGRLHLSWPMLFLVGWLIYELTTKPTLGAVTVCLKYGWEDFRGAIWLRRVDPRRLRGRACFWLYLASGLAKTAGVAGLMSIAFVAINPRGPTAQGPRGAAIIEMLAWTGLTMLAGLCCATLALGYAVVLARLGGFKLWLSRDLHRARRHNDWPPYGPSILQNNRLQSLLVGAMFLFIFPLIILESLVIIIAAQINDRIAPIVGIGGMVFLLFGYPVLILICRDRMSRWLIASHPSECWEMNAVLCSDDENIAKMIGDPLE